MATYKQGQGITIRGTFKDENNALIDPEYVYFTVRNPNGAYTVYTYNVIADIATRIDPDIVAEAIYSQNSITRISQGVYELELIGNIGRTWYYRIESNNPNAVDENSFSVTHSIFS